MTSSSGGEDCVTSQRVTVALDAASCLWVSGVQGGSVCPSQSLTHEGVVSPGSPRWEASALGVGVREAALWQAWSPEAGVQQRRLRSRGPYTVAAFQLFLLKVNSGLKCYLDIFQGARRTSGVTTGRRVSRYQCHLGSFQ